MSDDGPKDRDKALRAAAFRMLGATQAEAATAAEVGIRSLRRWESAEWWPALCDEARTTVHLDLERLALRTVQGAMQSGDAATARWALERLRPDVWGPGPTRVDLGSSSRVRIVVEVPEPAKRGDP